MKLLILSFFILTSLYSGVLPKEYYEIKDVKKKKESKSMKMMKTKK